MPNPFFLELVRNTVLSGLVRALGRVAELSLRWPMRYRSLSSASSRPANFESSHCRASQVSHTRSPAFQKPPPWEKRRHPPSSFFAGVSFLGVGWYLSPVLVSVRFSGRCAWLSSYHRAHTRL